LTVLDYIYLRKKGPVTLWALLPVLLLFSQVLFSQSEISGIINDYSVVETISLNSVTVSNPEMFQEGDTVLLIQMKGFGILTSPPEDYGKQQDINDAGNYEFLLIENITGNTIYFTREFLKVYNAEGVIQLIKVKGYRSARVTGTLTAEPWNGETGGVLALMVTNTLMLDANIDLSGKGFTGGKPVIRVVDECSADNPAEYGKFSFPEGSVYAGRKGEGPVTWYREGEFSFPVNNLMVHGRGRIGTGGGGGNGKFSGGGGGANYGQGGFGGGESESCPSFLINGQGPGGVGGYRLEDHLYIAGGTFINRFFLGGGGGGSTEEMTGRKATDGGNGGGLVIIIADRIESNAGHGIYANGGIVAAPSTAGAGGGGGGGTIVLSTDNYQGAVNLYARGGKGGDVNHALKAGTGGGGGGGTIIFSGSTLPQGVNTFLQPGASGTNIIQNDPYGSTIGTPGGLIEELEISLNGLLFNGIRTERNLICEGTGPDILQGTQPRGGILPYSYQWSKKTGAGNWIPIDGATGKDYQPGILVETTVFKRTVRDNDVDPVIDISNLLTITVQPKILGNIISQEQTICEGETALPVTGEPPVQGGTGDYQYMWMKYTDALPEWRAADNENGLLDYSPPPLFNSTGYMRIATSGVCIDNSNIIQINVHPLINSNLLDESQTICHGNTPLPVTGEQPGGGLGEGSYAFIWETYLNDSWSLIDGENSAGFQPGPLTGNSLFRRTVTSGVCADISNTQTITVLPLVTNNIISGGGTICYMDSPGLLAGTAPAGGNGNYRYVWEFNNGSGWITAEGSHDSRDYPANALADITQFRRITYSGPNDACSDISNSILIDFHPFSYAEISGPAATICVGEQFELSFSLSGEGPWNMIISGSGSDILIENITTQMHTATVFPFSADSTTHLYQIVSLTDNHGCQSPPSNLTGTASVRAYAFPDPDPVAAAEVCGLVARLDASTGFGNIQWESEYSQATFNNPANRLTDVTVTDYGPHIFTLTRSNRECSASADIMVTFHEQPGPPFAGNNKELQFVFDTFLEAELPLDIPSAFGVWDLLEGSATIVFPGDPATVVNNLGFGENILRWSVYNGVCEPVSGNVTIAVKDLDRPNAFSPNNSGYNDRFIIRGLENSSVNEISIFNRQGNVVYSARNYLNDWEGRGFNGEPLPEDTYYYVLNVDNRYSYKGFIILKR
jgi:gliding motility-associated-like protein